MRRWGFSSSAEAVGGFVAGRLADAGHNGTALVPSQDAVHVVNRAWTETAVIDLAVLALRMHNRQIEF